MDEAQNRCETLKREDNNKHNIFIGEVGCWCPWDPSPDEVGDGRYAETQLNTLMKKYNENQEKREDFYSTRTEAMRKLAEKSG